jgi:putative ABC transport system ATP-binding protein
MIELQDVSRVYERSRVNVTALRGVTFTVQPGEFVVVRGASGSGKSTLLHILGCLDRPSGGAYLLNGEDAGVLSDRSLSRLRARQIGFIFQSFHLLPRTTAVENVEVPMSYADRPMDRRRALAALDRVGLRERADHYATELSGGEQQRVAVARALINDPALILADEPTGNLDERAGREVMRLLQDLHAEGRTIVLVTHDDGVAAYAKRRIVLQDGVVVSDEEVIA